MVFAAASRERSSGVSRSLGSGSVSSSSEHTLIARQGREGENTISPLQGHYSPSLTECIVIGIAYANNISRLYYASNHTSEFRIP